MERKYLRGLFIKLILILSAFSGGSALAWDKWDGGNDMFYDWPSKEGENRLAVHNEGQDSVPIIDNVFEPSNEGDLGRQVISTVIEGGAAYYLFSKIDTNLIEGKKLVMLQEALKSLKTESTNDEIFEKSNPKNLTLDKSSLQEVTLDKPLTKAEKLSLITDTEKKIGEARLSYAKAKAQQGFFGRKVILKNIAGSFLVIDTLAKVALRWSALDRDPTLSPGVHLADYLINGPEEKVNEIQADKTAPERSNTQKIEEFKDSDTCADFSCTFCGTPFCHYGRACYDKGDAKSVTVFKYTKENGVLGKSHIVTPVFMGQKKRKNLYDPVRYSSLREFFEVNNVCDGKFQFRESY